MNEVIVSPTWGETWKYANASGQYWWTALGILLIIAGIVLIAKLAYKSTGWIVGGVVVIALGLSSILGKPIAIHISNDKKVTQEYLDKVGHDYIIDSCYKNNLLINAPYKAPK